MYETKRPDLGAYVARNFPQCDPYIARLASFHVYMRHHKREIPDVDEVRQRIDELEGRCKWES
jgi:light-regulated signal transduction histidine kinase (bacteriophytochrome)